ncbi:MAG: DUF1992 domain-containing protein [Comamonadaceae bacterium]|nr:DUF1992 domain-containing protein [Comamonadaceae bacterium]
MARQALRHPRHDRRTRRPRRSKGRAGPCSTGSRGASSRSRASRSTTARGSRAPSGSRRAGSRRLLAAARASPMREAFAAAHRHRRDRRHARAAHAQRRRCRRAAAIGRLARGRARPRRLPAGRQRHAVGPRGDGQSPERGACAGCAGLPRRVDARQRRGLRSAAPLTAVGLLDALVEQRIARAIAEGAFDDLPGAGKPLILDGDRLIPEDLRVAYRVLKNAGYIPPEIEEAP